MALLGEWRTLGELGECGHQADADAIRHVAQHLQVGPARFQIWW